jgi:hypothetical protein
MFSRGKFLAATGALALVPALSLPSIAQPKAPRTLEEHFRETLGPDGPTAYFFVRPPIDRWGRILSLSYVFYNRDGGHYGNGIDLDMIQHATVLREAAIHNARALGHHARLIWELAGRPDTDIYGIHKANSMLLSSQHWLNKDHYPLPIQDLI